MNWKIGLCESAVARNFVSTMMFERIDLKHVPQQFFLVRAFTFSDYFVSRHSISCIPFVVFNLHSMENMAMTNKHSW